ncbi:MAG TPA: hypothetical protein ENJ95_21415 [Bacteroidetes bacterium]|nr:hypothetical protein [Bacteroidota bacterium]
MKIEIKNLGPIHHFEFDLEKDLHLLYGENNVGKSFAVNVLYCLIKAFYSNKDKSGIKDTDHQKKSNIEKIRSFWENILLKNFNENLDITYDSVNPINAIDQNLAIEIKIDLTHYSISLSKGYSDSDFTLSQIELNKAGINLDKDENLVADVAQYYFSDTTNQVGEIFSLPASRSGLYLALSGMGEIMARLSQIGGSTTIGLPSLPLSVSDYYLTLMKGNGNGHKGINLLGKKIENKFLHGTISLNQQNKKIYYQPFGAEKEIHISQGASMVSELAPIVLYLKNILGGSVSFSPSLLIIEEPEAHLHPKVQVQLMEIFAELTKHHVKVILTSHSNYMFNKLSNMLLKKEIGPEKVKVYHMEMTDKGSIVKEDMKATAEGIEDHNFSGVAEKLYNERLQTYHVLNEEGNVYKRTPKE